MTITFRKITPSDCSFVSILRNSVTEEFLHTSSKYTPKEVKEWIRDNNPNWYIIEYDKKDVGYFRCSNVDLDTKSLYVGADIMEENRGLGLGYKSYVEFIKFINSQGFDILKLEVLSTNTRAINLYKKLGFITTKVERNSIEKNGQMIDNIFMELTIK